MKAVHRMSCCCCGEYAGRWEQHWNRDTGYGICVSCVDWQRGRGTSETEIADLYGKEGVNWGKESQDA
jgi:hypothetical protein